MAVKKNNTSKKKSTPHISPSRCPEGMTPQQWQRSLRRQIAETENFGIYPPDHDGLPFIVRSPKTGRRYRVAYFGAWSPYNRCECMDFKTSRLGTCKHIEAIGRYGGGKYNRNSVVRPLHTSVYVDYVDGRKIKICYGSDSTGDLRAIASELFDRRGVLRDTHCDPSEFIRKARMMDADFEWESDAMNLLIEHRDRALREKIVAERYASSLFDGLLKTSLHPYQADGVRFAFTNGRTINADEMGLGKTVQAIATAELLRREKLVSSVIIICPTSLKYQWYSEIKRFTDSPVVVVEGSLLARKEQLDDQRYFYRICSFHSISNNIKAGYIPRADMIIYDELQRLKNKETKMGQQLRKLESQYVMALSGTPLENKLDELYSVTQLVDQFVLGPYYKFTADTTLTDETGKIIGYRNLNTIAERLVNTMIRRRKADVKLQMPARSDKNLFVPMTKEQRVIHDEYKFQVGVIIQKWRRFKFLNEKDRRRLLLFLSMMRMVCDSTFILDQTTRHDTKIDETLAIISDLLEQPDGKVVIFSQWERMLRLLAESLSSAGIDFCFLHGGVPSPKRKDLIDRFTGDKNCRIFLSTDAGATGLNLQVASLLINLDLPWNPAVLEQRIARIYRLGQANPVQIINMIAPDSIEERMLSTLAFKSNLSAGILDGGDDAIFLENSKFEKIVEIVDNVVAEEPEVVTAAKNEPEIKEDSSKSPSKSEAAPEPPARKASPAPAAEMSAEMSGLVSGAIKAIGQFANALRQPGAAEALAEALVKEDPETGQTTLNIPVPDKSTVVNIFAALSTILNR